MHQPRGHRRKALVAMCPTPWLKGQRACGLRWQRGLPPFPITLLGGRQGNPASPAAHLKQVRRRPDPGPALLCSRVYSARDVGR